MGERTITRTTIECDGCDLAIEVDGKLEAEFKGAGTRPLGTRPGPWFTVRIDARTEEAYPIHSDLRGVDRIYCESCIRSAIEALDDLKGRGLVHAAITSASGFAAAVCGAKLGRLIVDPAFTAQLTCPKCQEVTLPWSGTS